MLERVAPVILLSNFCGRAALDDGSSGSLCRPYRVLFLVVGRLLKERVDLRLLLQRLVEKALAR